MQETEIKLAVGSPAEGRRRLRAAGFQVLHKRVFEQNTIYDTKSGVLRNSRRLLRIRQAGKKATVTFKGPPAVGKHKSRQELELEIADPKILQSIVQELGFAPSFRYDKYRTEFQHPGEKGVATLDETPVGTFLELEGSPRWIDRTAKTMGFSEADYITASYARLYAQ
ncbi:MAG TPA: class IV adenylate cyclase [Candidatus Limnocylindrales bacterium]|nr:class IV adenylate cyclase [Candidatus Limnocylindrales bacterium]